jgi:cytochrome c-type biogenesis protein CcmE
VATTDEGASVTPRRKRLYMVAGIVAGVAAATAIALLAFRDNLSYFYNPTQIAAGEAPRLRSFRVGGLVTKGSLRRSPGSLEVRFVLTDLQSNITVSYSGVLPDLFREGQGVIAHGRLGDGGLFVADEVLAKHDEKYMPPEVAKSLKGPVPAEGKT